MESVEALSREAEGLKVKLEEERQKLNDVPCEYLLHWKEVREEEKENNRREKRGREERK